MGIQELGSVGEFVGAILFFISLIYLSLQIRHSTRTAEFTTLREIQKDWCEVNSPADPRVTAAVEKELRNETLTSSEQFYLRSYFMRHMRVYETLWFASDRKLLDAELFRKYTANMSDIVALGRNRERWELYKTDLFHDGFVRFASDFIEEHPSRQQDVY